MIASILDKIQAEVKLLLLMGDVNFDRLTENPENQNFEEELLSYGVTRLPLPATRITNVSKSSIDCICTNFPEETINFSIHQAGLSDHTGQTCLLKLKSKTTQPTVSEFKRNFSNQNLESFKTELMKEDWSGVHSAPDAEGMYDAFYKIVRLNLDQTCPSKRTRIKIRPKIKFKHNEEVKLLKEEFLRAFRRHELTGSAVDKEIMNIKKKTYDLKLRNLKRNAATEHINGSDNKSKALWNIINSEKQARSTCDTPYKWKLTVK